MRFGLALLVFLTSGALFVAGCSSATTVDDGSAAPLSISLSAGDLVPAFDPAVTTYELTSFTVQQFVSLTVTGRTAHVLGLTTSPGVPVTLPTVPITAGGTIVINVDPGDDGTPAATYTINIEPADFPTFTFANNGAEDGQILLTPFPFLGTTPVPYLLIVNTHGEVLYYARKGTDQVVTDLKRQTLPDGTQYITYLSEGAAHLLDTKMNLIKDYTVLATDKHPAYAADYHDIHVLGPDHVIIEAYIKETVTNIPKTIPQTLDGSNVYASVIQEIDQGQVVFDWQTTDFPELYGMSTEANDFTNPAVYADYSHLNSLVIDPVTNNPVASFRHLDCVMELNRADGSILWRLGGFNDTFGTTAEQKSSHQHFASFLPDGRLMMYDNGVVNTATRILTFGLDTVNNKVTSFDSFPLFGYFSEFMGSTQWVGTHSQLIGLGTSEVGQPDVLMLDRNTGATTFSLTLGSDDYYSYRAQWESGLGD